MGPESTSVPSPNDPPAWLGWIVTRGVTETADLLQRLHVPSGEHRHFQLPYERSTAKNYFLSRCLLDVQYAIGSLLRLRSWLASPEDATAPSGIVEITTNSIAIEQGGWRRRLVEALARLVLFSTTNTDDHYWAYLLVNEAYEARREADNFAKDWSAKSECLTRRARYLTDQIPSETLTTTVWYAKPEKGAARPPSATEIVRAALRHAREFEQSALGYSYGEGFSEPSRLVHFSTSPARKAIERATLIFGSSSIYLLALTISRRVAKLAGLSDVVPQAEPAVRGSLLPDVGDFVVVTLDRENVYLAEVIAWRDQRHAIGGVRLRFLDAAPYEDVTEDDFPSNLVQPFLPIAALKAETVALHPALAACPEEDLLRACREAAREAWTLAMKDVWLDGLAKQ
jgi:hypothetical protein